MKSEVEHSTGPKRRTYILIFLGLIVLTGLEVLVSGLTGPFRIPLLVGTSIIKALLVIMFYMHLKDEQRLYMVIFFLPLLLITPLLLMITQ